MGITDSPIDMCVGFSQVEAGRAVADFLYQLRHTCAGTITANDARALRRQEAFSERFTQITGNQVQDCNTGGPGSIGAGRRALADLIDVKGHRKGAVFCSSDLLAHGVLIEARARGLSVPGDLAVFGFGDQDFARDLEPALSTVMVDRLRMSEIAADMLLRRILGHTPERPVLDLGSRIVRRSST